MKTRVCTKCSVRKSISEYTRHLRGLRRSCDECQRAYKREYNRTSGEKRRRINTHQRNRRFVYTILQNSKCMDCGDARWQVLEFDHRIRSKKSFGIGTAVRSTRSIASLQKEISKCDIVCASCHRLRTAKQLGFSRVDWE